MCGNEKCFWKKRALAKKRIYEDKGAFGKRKVVRKEGIWKDRKFSKDGVSGSKENKRMFWKEGNLFELLWHIRSVLCIVS